MVPDNGSRRLSDDEFFASQSYVKNPINNYHFKKKIKNIMEHKKHPERHYWHILSMPLIYSIAVPMVIFDLFLEIYHRVCFPIYGLPLVPRRLYFKMDRHKLKKLRKIDRFNCDYCSYATGLMAYASKIIAETEKYWCGIKHQYDPAFIEPDHHENFIPYENFTEECKLTATNKS